MVAVPEGRAETAVREFGTFTGDLIALADWLQQCGVTTVAMESTGVYWIPLFELLERRGFEVKLVDARHVKNVTGRKSDILDCQWIQQLHTYGLLAGAFRPADEICVLRSYLRQREMLTQTASMHIQHMQKALQQMNLLLHNVVSDITGVTGMKIIKALLAGERDPQVLASHRDKKCHNDRATIAKSLVGNYRTEHLFALRQAVDLYEIYQNKIADCDEAIVKQVSAQPDLTDEPFFEGQLSARCVLFQTLKAGYHRPATQCESFTHLITTLTLATDTSFLYESSSWCGTDFWEKVPCVQKI